MNKNQNGFANLEIILILGIIAIFSTVAVPKMARILDKVALDYELKHLYSELNLARSIGKSSTFHGGIFNGITNPEGAAEIWIYSGKHQTKNVKNSYQIRRASISHYRHKLSNEISLNLDMSGEYNTPLKINCYKFGISKTLTLTSKYSNNAYIYIDTVGRSRGYYVK